MYFTASPCCAKFEYAGVSRIERCPFIRIYRVDVGVAVLVCLDATCGSAICCVLKICHRNTSIYSSYCLLDQNYLMQAKRVKTQLAKDLIGKLYDEDMDESFTKFIV